MAEARPPRAMNFFRNAAGMLLTSTVNVPLGLVTSIVLARYLSVDDRGLYSLALTFTALVAILSRVGWPSASIYRLRRVGSDPAEVAGAGLVAVAAISAVVVPVCLFFEPFFTERVLDNAPARVYYLVLALGPLQLLIQVLSAIARGIDRFRLQNWASVLFNLGLLGVAVGVLIGEQAL
ncbi:MAG: oligosaccharide flippase family protein [Proteobacteria bacterium]|nr:oligosaccharide flippase family protein [Pseudomonadota bacterium]